MRRKGKRKVYGHWNIIGCLKPTKTTHVSFSSKVSPFKKEEARRQLISQNQL